MATWHYIIDDQQHGPVSLNDLQALAKRGAIDEMTSVWRDGMADWVNLGSVPELTGPREHQQLPRIVPFEVEPDQMTSKVLAHMKAGLLTPSDVPEAGSIQTLKKLLVPVRVFSAAITSNWTAESGKLMANKRVQWSPISGQVAKEHEGVPFLVAVGPWAGSAKLAMVHLGQAVTASDPLLRGVEFTTPAEPEDATQLRARKHVEAIQAKECLRMVPGQRKRRLQLNNTYTNSRLETVYVPVYSGDFVYGGEAFKFSADGVTGRISAPRPISYKKFGAAAGIFAALVVCFGSVSIVPAVLEERNAAKEELAEQDRILRVEQIRQEECQELIEESSSLAASVEPDPQSILDKRAGVEACGDVPAHLRTAFAQANIVLGRGAENRAEEESYYRAALEMDTQNTNAQAALVDILLRSAREFQTKGDEYQDAKDYDVAEGQYELCLAGVEDAAEIDPESAEVAEVSDACTAGAANANGLYHLKSAKEYKKHGDGYDNDGLWTVAIGQYDIAIDEAREAKAKLGTSREADRLITSAEQSRATADRKVNTEAREVMAELLQTHYLDEGINMKIRVSGRDSNTIKLTWVLVDEVFVHHYGKGEDLQVLRELGFTKVLLSDGYTKTWTFDLE